MESANSLAHRAQVDRFFREEHGSILRDAEGTLRRFPALRPFVSAEDLLHETYLSYVSYVEAGRAISWSGEPSFRRVTLRRKAIDHLRAGRRRESEPLEDELAEELAERFEADLIDRVVAALSGLRAKRPLYFELLHMSFFLGLRVQEIAELVGERENTISVRKRRALAALRDEMQGLGVQLQEDSTDDDDPEWPGPGGPKGSRPKTRNDRRDPSCTARIAKIMDMSGARGMDVVGFVGQQNATSPKENVDNGGPDAQRPDLLCLGEDLWEALLAMAVATKMVNAIPLVRGRGANGMVAVLASRVVRRAAVRGWRSRN
jgi:RNA polymerase sigma factor (sigma-70 family)